MAACLTRIVTDHGCVEIARIDEVRTQIENALREVPEAQRDAVVSGLLNLALARIGGVTPSRAREGRAPQSRTFPGDHTPWAWRVR